MKELELKLKELESEKARNAKIMLDAKGIIEDIKKHKGNPEKYIVAYFDYKERNKEIDRDMYIIGEAIKIMKGEK